MEIEKEPNIVKAIYFIAVFGLIASAIAHLSTFLGIKDNPPYLMLTTSFSMSATTITPNTP